MGYILDISPVKPSFQSMNAYNGPTIVPSMFIPKCTPIRAHTYYFVLLAFDLVEQGIGNDAGLHLGLNSRITHS